MYAIPSMPIRPRKDFHEGSDLSSQSWLVTVHRSFGLDLDPHLKEVRSVKSLMQLGIVDVYSHLTLRDLLGLQSARRRHNILQH